MELLIWCQCHSNKIIIAAWFYRLGNLILLVLLMMQPFNFCEVYSIIILRLCSFKLCRVFLLTKCFVIGEKLLWNVLLDCFQLPGKSVFSEHKHARNVALKRIMSIFFGFLSNQHKKVHMPSCCTAQHFVPYMHIDKRTAWFFLNL